MTSPNYEVIFNLLEESQQTLSPAEIGRLLDINRKTVWGILQQLVQAGVIFKPQKGKYRAEKTEPWFHHFLAGFAYCSGKKIDFEIISNTKTDVDLSKRMFSYFVSETSESCGNHAGAGYSKHETYDDPEPGSEYPEIIVREV